MLDPLSLRQLLSHASVFVCPSVYEPMGIVNLEAMACGTAVGGISSGCPVDRWVSENSAGWRTEHAPRIAVETLPPSRQSRPPV
ncbi:glycosyltransferase [Streptomyces achromogenes]|uniref:glycosyltransferase n=1 Tax=Streptomyces achromogenes TaxID=67255 RepID=UPI0036BCD09E